MLDSEALGARIKKIRGRQNQKTFGKNIGVLYPRVSDYERGKVVPGPEILMKIAEIGRVSLDWLLTGKGRGPAANRVGEAVAEYEPQGPIIIATKQEARDRFAHLEVSDDYALVPLYSDSVAAGAGAFVEEEIESFSIIYSAWVRGPGPHTSIRVKGKSMEPFLPDGSIVGIDHSQQDPRRLLNKIVVARNKEGALTVKFLKKADDFWILQPANSEYDIIIMKKDQLEIVGKVSWYWGRPK